MSDALPPLSSPANTVSTLPASPAPLLNGMAALTHLGVIRAEGEEAAKFLHNQLTQDFALLGLSEARLCALCSAKGRMMASFIGFKRSHTEVLLLCSRDLLAATLKRLSMFVLRAKVKLSDASADFQLTGLAGHALDFIADYPSTAWSKRDFETSNLVTLYPALGQARALWVAPAGTPLPTASPLSLDLWQWGEVHSGVATLSTPLIEAFVPQMLNYESIGGVSFKKGCYPGQEVVARSQFRGTLKRRTYLVHSDAAPQAGQELFSPDDAEQACGQVVQAAPAPDGGWDALVSVQIASVAAGLHLGAAAGPGLSVLPLPYALLDDI